jgi:transmembrane protein 231
MQSAQLDDNNDGLPDRFEFNIVLPLADSERITGVSVVFFFAVQLLDQVRYTFDALAYYNYDGGVPIGSLFVGGDFVLKQGIPLLSKGGSYSPYSNDELLPTTVTKATRSNSLMLAPLLARYAARNLSMVLAPTVSVAHPSQTLARIGISPQAFNFTSIISIPSQPVRYNPPASELLKDAWIQYVSFFLVVWFLLFRISSFLYGHRLIKSYAVVDCSNLSEKYKY